MSRTDAHAPVWVHDFFGGVVRHDHARGVCIEETLERARLEANSRWKRYTHDARCPRVSYTQEYCDQTRLGYKCWNVVVGSDVCGGHNVRHYDKSVGCQVCDTVPVEPTCDRQVPGRYYHRLTNLYGQHVPSDVVNLYERVDRQRTRAALHDAARDWNANGDTDVEPPTDQHRHAASWYYW